MELTLSLKNKSFSRLTLHLKCLTKDKYNAHDLSRVMYAIVFHLEVLFINFNESVVLVTLSCQFGYSYVLSASVSHLNFHSVLFQV